MWGVGGRGGLGEKGRSGAGKKGRKGGRNGGKGWRNDAVGKKGWKERLRRESSTWEVGVDEIEVVGKDCERMGCDVI